MGPSLRKEEWNAFDFDEEEDEDDELDDDLDDKTDMKYIHKGIRSSKSAHLGLAPPPPLSSHSSSSSSLSASGISGKRRKGRGKGRGKYGEGRVKVAAAAAAANPDNPLWAFVEKVLDEEDELLGFRYSVIVAVDEVVVLDGRIFEANAAKAKGRS